MSSPGPPPPGPAFQVGDRVRVTEGMFAGLAGEITGPDPLLPNDWMVRLRIWHRDLEVGLPNWMLEPAPPE